MWGRDRAGQWMHSPLFRNVCASPVQGSCGLTFSCWKNIMRYHHTSRYNSNLCLGVAGDTRSEGLKFRSAPFYLYASRSSVNSTFWTGHTTLLSARGNQYCQKQNDDDCLLLVRQHAGPWPGHHHLSSPCPSTQQIPRALPGGRDGFV